MTDVRKWLDSLGLGQFGDAFAENAIDWELLPELNHELLEAMGISAVGHRMRILKAAANLVPQEIDPELRTATPSAGLASSPPTSSGEAERRQLTVMFCDLVGSTALSGALDAEEYRDLLGTYQSAAGEAIESFDGYIARYMGDGLLVYFGYPRAHEDDAERAVRAGLAIASRVGDLKTDSDHELAVRIGIATGLVIVGDIIGKDSAQEHAVLGETPNLAARLQASAEPGVVVIANETQQLIHGVFDCADRGWGDYKGFSKPLRSWSVRAERPSESRFEARRGHQLSALVGRDSELSLLLDRWEQARDGDGQVVVLCGEAGIGKSRLTEALREQVSPEAHRVLRYQCSPYHSQSDFYPIITALERELAFSTEDDDEDRAGKLEALLRRHHADAGSVLPLMAALLSVPLGDDYQSVDLGEPRQRQNLIDTLVAHTLQMTQQGPVLSIFEDAHWMDPSTLECLTALSDAIQDAPGLVLITSRPEREASWPAGDHVSIHTLTRLGRRHRLAMVEALTGGKPLPGSVLEAVMVRTDGIPLYVEELIRTTLQGEYLREMEDRYELLTDISEVGIPTTLRDSLSARLDHLDDAKEVAQLCAAIGRESRQELIQVVSSLDPEALDTALDRLVDADLLTRRERSNGCVFSFKHALLRDAAYESLLRGPRRVLHQLIADALRHHFTDTIDHEPELLAYHYTEAGQNELAVRYWKQAGLRARRRSASREAVDHLTRALDLLGELPTGAARDQEELEIQMALGASVLVVESFASPSIERIYLRAAELAQRTDAIREACLATRGIQVFHLMGGKTARALEHSERLMELAAHDQEGTYLVGAHHGLGQTLFLAGEFESARSVLEAGIDLLGSAPLQVDNWAGGQPGEQCHIYLALTLWALGYPDRGRLKMERALACSQAAGNPLSLINTLAFVAMFHGFDRNSAAMRDYAERGYAMATEYRSGVFQYACQIMRGTSLVSDGSTAEGVNEVRAGVVSMHSIGMQSWNALWLAPLMDPALNPDAAEQDIAMAGAAAKYSATNGERFFESETTRLTGLRALQSDPPAAEELLRDAVNIARRQRAKSLELRASTSLAGLLVAQGRHDDARSLLEPVYSWFSEGFDTHDLKDARGLLEALS